MSNQSSHRRQWHAGTSCIIYILACVFMVPACSNRNQRLTEARTLTIQSISGHYQALSVKANPMPVKALDTEAAIRPVLALGYRSKLRKKIKHLKDQLSQIERPSLSAKELDLYHRLSDRIGRWTTGELCGFETWLIFSPQIIDQATRVLHGQSTRQGKDASSSLGDVGILIDQEIKNLRVGMERGRVASRSYLLNAIEQIDALLPRLRERLNSRHVNDTRRQLDRPNRQEQKEHHTESKAALLRLKTFILNELMAHASDLSWLVNAPGGQHCYTQLLRTELGQDMTTQLAYKRLLTLASRYRRRLAGLAQSTHGIKLTTLLGRVSVDKSEDAPTDQVPHLEDIPQLIIPLEPPLSSTRRSDIYHLFKLNSGLHKDSSKHLIESYTRLLRRINRATTELGIYSRGWRLEHALQFLIKKGGLSTDAALMAITDVMNHPGRSVVDILHADRLLHLQKEAEMQLGDGFDTESFERVVLVNHREAISVIEARFRRWLGRPEWSK